jgi:hypothetical protein
MIGILKLITKNTEVALEDVMNVDMSSSMQMLAVFITRFSGPSAHRIKILCYLRKRLQSYGHLDDSERQSCSLHYSGYSSSMDVTKSILLVLTFEISS